VFIFRLAAKLQFEPLTGLPKIEVEGKCFDPKFSYKGATHPPEDLAWKCSAKNKPPLNKSQKKRSLPFLLVATSSVAKQSLLNCFREFDRSRQTSSRFRIGALANDSIVGLGPRKTERSYFV
jgi:hypothetical protein